MLVDTTSTTGRVVSKDIDRILSTSIDWTILENSTVLVTGAGGFIASYLIYTLLELRKVLDEGRCPLVIGIVRNISGARKRFRQYLDSPKFRLIEQDVCDPLSEDIRVNYIIHAASPASPTRFGLDPVGTIKANSIGTANMLDVGKRSEASRVLYISSSEVYGDVLNSAEHVTERMTGIVDHSDPRSCYAESKRLGEAMCFAWAKQYNTPTSIARPFHIYGPGIQENDGRVFADFIYDVVNYRDIQLYSDGKASRTFCYLSDAAEGLFRILISNESNVYNIGNPTCETSIEQLGRLLVSMYPERNLKLLTCGRSVGDTYMTSSVTRSRPSVERLSALGWKPTIGLSEGFRLTIESIEE